MKIGTKIKIKANGRTLTAVVMTKKKALIVMEGGTKLVKFKKLDYKKAA